MSSENKKIEDDEEEDTGYKVAKKVDMKTLVNQDAEDESLRRYKEALLGKEVVSGGVNLAPADDPRRVVVQELRVICQDRPGGDIVYDLTKPDSLQKMKETPFTLKEGCQYKIQVTFRVQHEIVSGLKYSNMVYRKGIRVAKEDEMLGSFGPQVTPHVVVFPRHGWEEAPSGMLARGAYKAKSKFVDDDKQTHLEYEYQFRIAKTWGEQASAEDEEK